MKILLLEPDKILGQIYTKAFEHEGHMTTLYHDAQSAIRGLDKQIPDLIICELQLAGHNGIEFLYELRSYSDWQTLPVMLLSNVPQHESGLPPKQWEHLGIVGYHYKPFTSLVALSRSASQLSISAKA